MKRDQRSDPVRKIVLSGESIAFGVCAIDPRNEWFQTVTNQIRDFQDDAVLALNYGVPGCVISPDSPGYSILPEGSKPSALERYEEELIETEPDVVIIAHGLNDSRCGYVLQGFIRDWERIVSNTKRRTEAIVVTLSPYWVPQHTPEIWRKMKPEWASDPVWKAFALEGPELVRSYITAMKSIAEEQGILFVDVFSVLQECPWFFNDDAVHLNDLGHRVVGHAVFNAIAANCSFVSRRSVRQARAGNFDFTTTGGTKCPSRMIAAWHGR